MSMKKLSEELMSKFKKCKTDEDYKGFIREMGIDLSSEDLDSVCGGLSGLASEEALSALSERMNNAGYLTGDGGPGIFMTDKDFISANTDNK